MNLSGNKKLDSKKKKLDKFEKIKKMIEKENQVCNCETGCRHDFAKKLWNVLE